MHRHRTVGDALSVPSCGGHCAAATRGSGTRFKVLEALACELPLVSTTVGTDGIELMDGVHVRLVDAPAAFAAAVIDLLSDAVQRERPAANGLALLRAKYSFAVNSERMRRIVIGVLSARQMLKCLRPSLLGKSFLVKTHEAPTHVFRLLLRLRQVQATYIFRDPRDAALSVFEHGEQARAHGEASPFARFQTVEEAIDFVAGRLPIWEAWTACPRVFVTRYEELLADPAAVLAQLFRSWSVQVPPGVIAQVVAAYDAQRIADQPIAKGLHLNVAKAGRFRSEMSAAQQARCAAAFGAYLQRMGYNA